MRKREYSHVPVLHSLPGPPTDHRRCAESGSEARAGGASLLGKKKTIFCEGFVKENCNSNKIWSPTKIFDILFLLKLFSFSKKSSIFFYDLEVKSPCGSIPAIYKSSKKCWSDEKRPQKKIVFFFPNSDAPLLRKTAEPQILTPQPR